MSRASASTAFRQRGSVSIVFRAIPFQVRTIDDLGLPEVVRRLAEEPRGIILFTGTTGSGKSTTLAAMIDHINSTRARHIVTIEDPIEYLHRDKLSIINQREVGSDTKSFARAMRRVLRQDPDVILIGEMRDEETVRTALSAAETGHLVISTLHTLDASETINRIIDFFPPHLQQQARVMLASTLKGAISQRLVPRITARGGCRLRGDGRHRPDPGSDPQPRGDRQDHRGDLRGRLLWDADLRPGAARLRRWGLVSEEVAMDNASSPHDFKLMLAAGASARAGSSRSKRGARGAAVRQAINNNPIAQVGIVVMLIAVTAFMFLKPGGGEESEEAAPTEATVAIAGTEASGTATGATPGEAVEGAVEGAIEAASVEAAAAEPSSVPAPPMPPQLPMPTTTARPWSCSLSTTAASMTSW